MTCFVIVAVVYYSTNNQQEVIMANKTIFLSAAILAISTLFAASPQLESYIKHCIESSENDLDPNMQGSEFHWEFTGKYKIIYADKNLFSFYADELEYTGGAHGNAAVTVGTIFRKSGKRITLKDIAPTAENQKKLLNIITAATAKEFKCTVKELPEKLLNMPKLTENFYLNDKGITFVYNEYEIASKARGAVKIFIPYSAVNFKKP